jgi:hypothetical protein
LIPGEQVKVLRMKGAARFYMKFIVVQQQKPLTSFLKKAGKKSTRKRLT